jgi:hypothetical protein
MGDIKLVHAIFVKDESHCIDRMLDTVLPYVDASYIMIDDRTTDNTKELAESRGCITKEFTFNNFSKTKNTLLDWVNPVADWVIGIAPDETIDSKLGEAFKTLAQKAQNTDVDAFYFPRRHWLDLEKEREYTEKNWYPDWQCRLIRADFPRIHMIRYVHEVIKGFRRVMHVKGQDIHHFNLYWKDKIDYDWDTMLRFYEELKALEIKESGKNIWPDKGE